MSVTINGTSGVVFNDASTQNTAATGFGFKNRIINGQMVLDQRNAGASITPTSTAFTLDRWQAVLSQSSKYSIQQNASSVTPPVGFINYLGVTSSSAYSRLSTDYFGIVQSIEGLNCTDLNWGSANAVTITLSFWVRSSLTGTFSGRLANSASNRSYVFTYTINSANTFEQKTITIAGDTSGTWLTTNGVGIAVWFDLGSGSNYQTTASSWQTGNFAATSSSTSVVGTNGATFYITGVQLEKGSTATSFDYRPYSTELQLAQRYFANSLMGSGYSSGATSVQLNLQFPVTMRTTPTITVVSALTVTDSAANYTQSSANSGTFLGSANGGLINSLGNFSGLTQFRPVIVNISGLNNPITASAEL